MDDTLTTVLGYLESYQYLAMFGLLFLCGLGLPIPEEVTLLGSGLLVGWGSAEFVPASAACVLGILAGDSMIFGLGYIFGRDFLRSRPMRLLLSPRRQRKVSKFFQKHGNKAVFFARFFAGVRIGVYAYAGSQRMSWVRFLFLDFLGAMISGPTSIGLAWWVALHVDKNQAQETALNIVQRAGWWIVGGVLLFLALYFLVVWIRGRRRHRGRTESAPAARTPAARSPLDTPREPPAA